MKTRLSSGDYIVCDDETGRRIGTVRRQQIPTAKVGKVQFVACVGTHRRLDICLGAHETLTSAVAHVERAAGK